MIRDFLKCSFLLLAAACSIAPVIPLQPLPAPAMEKLPVHVALITDDAFRNYEFDGPRFLAGPQAEDPITKKSRLHYQLGELNVDLFNQVTNSLFAQVTGFDSMEELKASGCSFDGILVPTVAYFNAGTGIDGNSVFANLSYQLRFFDQEVRQILDWQVESQQLICPDMALCVDGYEQVMLVARRDIAARILSQFPEFPEITAWVKSVESGR